ncbi:WD40/YVTN/BNR-like repeat-containing protein [Polyangium aurulentum]|uniref:WD40/YVTN/BNR-like repeat-containing protein n=1 Tax=Polyangium aurulentum TaxID=2567896 RepID=UPI0010AEE7F8|nr:exo-alpha-sialidase [Polyangium aurulentum]UQA54633.1 exo-alpha-sialidase [Polyangium aurulentum]
MIGQLLVATRKGLFQLERGGAGWSIARVSFLGDAVSMVLPDPRDGTLYAGLGLGHFGVKLRRSRDGGARWEDIAAPAYPRQPDGVRDTLPDGREWPWRVEQIWSLEAGKKDGALWCGTIPGGLFRSDDHGDSWSLVQSLWDHPKRKAWFGGGYEFPGIHSICVEDTGALTLGVSCGGVWRSEDDGATWDLRGEGMYAAFMPPERSYDMSIQDPHRIVQCPSNPDMIWVQHHNGVFRSTDRGAHWQDVPAAVPASFGFAVAVHPRDGNTAWLVPAVKDENRTPVDAKVVVSRTRDGGKTWTVLREGLPQEHAYDIVYRHALDVDGTGDVLACGSSTGALWISEDGGDRWQEISAHLPPIYAVRFVKGAGS